MITEEIQNYKVCILTAGIGSRLGERTKFFNKALLRVGNKAAISHIVDQFPDDIEFVIALGYKGDIVKQYLTLFHPEKKFTFIDIDKYSIPGTGPGYALNKCKNDLQSKFFFFSCDTITDLSSIIYSADQYFHNNWIGYSDIDIKFCNQYCTLSIDEKDKVEKLIDKSEGGTDKAFIGVMFINDYIEFWNYMCCNDVLINNEIQISTALSKMSELYSVELKWWDVGCDEGLKKARDYFKGLDNLDKLDEELYINEKYSFVLKYFYNVNIIKNRLERAKRLGSLVPNITDFGDNFYKYNFVNGKDLFRINNQHEIIASLLDYSKNNLWKKIELSDYDKLIFRDSCRKFYYDKTLARLTKLHKERNIEDKSQYINDVYVPTVQEIFKLINWDDISRGVSSQFHGDFNFSNILIDSNNNFKFLDWRQDFCNLIEYGDIYYDFGKLYHSFLVPHSSIKNSHFYVLKNNDSIKTFIEIPINIEKSKDIFESFILKEEYDLKKIKILTAIILLNMSALHEFPLDEYLFYFGKYYLWNILRG